MTSEQVPEKTPSINLDDFSRHDERLLIRIIAEEDEDKFLESDDVKHKKFQSRIWNSVLLNFRLAVKRPKLSVADVQALYIRIRKRRKDREEADQHNGSRSKAGPSEVTEAVGSDHDAAGQSDQQVEDMQQEPSQVDSEKSKEPQESEAVVQETGSANEQAMPAQDILAAAVSMIDAEPPGQSTEQKTPEDIPEAAVGMMDVETSGQNTEQEKPKDILQAAVGMIDAEPSGQKTEPKSPKKVILSPRDNFVSGSAGPSPLSQPQPSGVASGGRNGSDSPLPSPSLQVNTERDNTVTLYSFPDAGDSASASPQGVAVLQPTSDSSYQIVQSSVPTHYSQSSQGNPVPSSQAMPSLINLNQSLSTSNSNSTGNQFAHVQQPMITQDTSMPATQVSSGLGSQIQSPITHSNLTGSQPAHAHQYPRSQDISMPASQGSSGLGSQVQSPMSHANLMISQSPSAQGSPLSASQGSSGLGSQVQSPMAQSYDQGGLSSTTLRPPSSHGNPVIAPQRGQSQTPMSHSYVQGGSSTNTLHSLVGPGFPQPAQQTISGLGSQSQSPSKSQTPVIVQSSALHSGQGRIIPASHASSRLGSQSQPPSTTYVHSNQVQPQSQVPSGLLGRRLSSSYSPLFLPGNQSTSGQPRRMSEEFPFIADLLLKPKSNQSSANQSGQLTPTNVPRGASAAQGSQSAGASACSVIRSALTTPLDPNELRSGLKSLVEKIPPGALSTTPESADARARANVDMDLDQQTLDQLIDLQNPSLQSLLDLKKLDLDERVHQRDYETASRTWPTETQEPITKGQKRACTEGRSSGIGGIGDSSNGSGSVYTEAYMAMREFYRERRQLVLLEKYHIIRASIGKLLQIKQIEVRDENFPTEFQTFEGFKQRLNQMRKPKAKAKLNKEKNTS